MASIGGGVLPDLNYLKTSACEELIQCLNLMPGMKDLVLDADLMKPLDRIAGLTILKSNGVEKIFKLEQAKTIHGSPQRIYMLRPSIKLVQFIAEQINLDVNKDVKRAYKIVFVPRKLAICEKILEDEGVYGYISDISELEIDLIHLDKDLLSLEMPSFYKTAFMDNDMSWYFTISRSIVTLQQIFGTIHNVYGFGEKAQAIHSLTGVIFDDVGKPKDLDSQIGHLFIIDRDVDYVTPLCSQLIYEGLLDDTFGIVCGSVEFGPEITGTEKSTKLLLTSQDVIYEEIRNRHFTNVYGYVSAKLKEVQAGFDKRHNLNIQEMKGYVANELKDLKAQERSIQLHIGAGVEIITRRNKEQFVDPLEVERNILIGYDLPFIVNSLEDMMNRQVDSNLVLRLLCLLSLTTDGLNSQNYKFFKTRFMHSYGFDHLLTWNHLNNLGMLRQQEIQQISNKKQLNKFTAAVNISKSHYQTTCKKLKLIPSNPEEINLKMPTDMSYIFGGSYTPLACKLIEYVLSKEDFIGLEEVLKNIIHFKDIKPKSVRGKIPKRGGSLKGDSGLSSSPKVVLVYFVGGCTYSEIAALRFLGKVKGFKFIVATTATINSSSIIEIIKKEINEN